MSSTLTPLTERMAAMTTTTELEELAARVRILEMHHAQMLYARNDYGAGQRRAELRRAQRLLVERNGYADTFELTHGLPVELLLETFEQIALPRMRRMSPSRRGAWFAVLLELVKAGAELLPDRAELELENGAPVYADTAIEVWADRRRV